MMEIPTASVILALLFSLTTSAQNAKGTNKVEPLPRDLEIQLALSALPPHLRDDASVYVLNPDKGFEVARKGANGFHALVARTGDDTFRGTWPLKEYRDDILYPISFDEAAAKGIFDGLEKGEDDIFPDRASMSIAEGWRNGPVKAMERQFAGFVSKSTAN